MKDFICNNKKLIIHILNFELFSDYFGYLHVFFD